MSSRGAADCRCGSDSCSHRSPPIFAEHVLAGEPAHSEQAPALVPHPPTADAPPLGQGGVRYPERSRCPPRCSRADVPQRAGRAAIPPSVFEGSPLGKEVRAAGSDLSTAEGAGTDSGPSCSLSPPRAGSEITQFGLKAQFSCSLNGGNCRLPRAVRFPRLKALVLESRHPGLESHSPNLRVALIKSLNSVSSSVKWAHSVADISNIFGELRMGTSCSLQCAWRG